MANPKTRESVLEAKGPEPQKFTLAEAFDYFNIPDHSGTPELTDINLERAIRSVSFLLYWMSHHGNEQVDGYVAHGLAYIVERCAEGVKR
jgi:hypothetical protein